MICGWRANAPVSPILRSYDYVLSYISKFSHHPQVHYRSKTVQLFLQVISWKTSPAPSAVYQNVKVSYAEISYAGETILKTGSEYPRK